MAETCRGDAGGIRGLCGLLDEHRGAIDVDCLRLGLDLADLGTERFSWARLKAVVTYAPADSALVRSIHGDAAQWDATEHLLAAAVDALNAANWQRSGGKGRRPKPVPRPGRPKNERKLGSASMSIEEAARRFEQINRGGD